MAEEREQPVTFVRTVEPFRIAVYLFAVLWGSLTILNFGQSANSAIRQYPGMGGWIFLVLLTIGGATSLLSYLMKTVVGLKVEVAGLTLLILLCLAYTVWTPFSVGFLRGLGLQLSMLILIAIPGYFVRRAMVRYISSLEQLEQQHAGGKESGSNAVNSGRVDRRDYRRWRRP